MDEVVRLADINRIKDKSAPIAAKYGLRRMYLFGSHAKGIATKDSDIDLLFEKGEKLSLPGGGQYASGSYRKPGAVFGMCLHINMLIFIKIAWDTIQEDVPLLKAKIEEILDKM